MPSVDKNKQNDLWNIQVSIAKAIAKLQAPSLAQLHHEILEEIGHGPGLDLVDYFVSIAKISEDEVQKYFQYIGAPIKGSKKKIRKNQRLDLADRVAEAPAPTVLKFRRIFQEKYNEPPSEEITEYFLKKIQTVPRDNAAIMHKSTRLNFVKTIAAGTKPTVLQFRNEFIKKYGCSPSPEETRLFLAEIQEKSCLEEDEEDFESKANFAETVATGLNLTILQFRQAYEKVYNETPSVDIIDIFIKSLPCQGDKSGII